MSKDKTPAILEAVAGLPVRQRGLVLGIIKALNEPKRYPNALKEFRGALKAARTPAAKASKGFFDSAKYFVTRAGLYVWSEFAGRILPAYKAIVRRGIKGVDSIDLSRNMYDREIVAEYLGGEEVARKHAFTPDQVAELIDAQWGGKPGLLLNNGYANILYVLGKDDVLFPASVYWNSGSDEWVVGACTFDDGYWLAGRRVLRNRR
jgi:hypothetical protein